MRFAHVKKCGKSTNISKTCQDIESQHFKMVGAGFPWQTDLSLGDKRMETQAATGVNMRHGEVGMRRNAHRQIVFEQLQDQGAVFGGLGMSVFDMLYGTVIRLQGVGEEKQKQK